MTTHDGKKTDKPTNVNMVRKIVIMGKRCHMISYSHFQPNRTAFEGMIYT